MAAHPQGGLLYGLSKEEAVWVCYRVDMFGPDQQARDLLPRAPSARQCKAMAAFYFYWWDAWPMADVVDWFGYPSEQACRMALRRLFAPPGRETGWPEWAKVKTVKEMSR